MNFRGNWFINVHEEQAILVGTNTVLQDNPSLTVREWAGKICANCY